MDRFMFLNVGLFPGNIALSRLLKSALELCCLEMG